MERESGYYWVRILKDSNWEIAEYDKHYKQFFVINSVFEYKDSNFDEIDERRIVREETTVIEMSEEEKEYIKKYVAEHKTIDSITIDNKILKIIQDGNWDSKVPLMRNPPPPPTKEPFKGY